MTEKELKELEFHSPSSYGDIKYFELINVLEILERYEEIYELYNESKKEIDDLKERLENG
jgi:hypothetical protein